MVRLEWVQACLDFLKANQVSQLTDEAWLRNSVLCHYCMTNVHLSSYPVLPQDASRFHGSIWAGLHVLQLTEDVYDVSKARNSNAEEPVDTMQTLSRNPATRMLKLVLTDGAQIVVAMEFKPWKSIDLTRLRSGAKVLYFNSEGPPLQLTRR